MVDLLIQGKGTMVTWWLVGKHEEHRDSLTGVKIAKSEGSLKTPTQRDKTESAIGQVNSETSFLPKNLSTKSNYVNKIVSFTTSNKLSSSNYELSSSHSPDNGNANGVPLPGTVQ